MNPGLPWDVIIQIIYVNSEPEASAVRKRFGDRQPSAACAATCANRADFVQRDTPYLHYMSQAFICLSGWNLSGRGSQKIKDKSNLNNNICRCQYKINSLREKKMWFISAKYWSDIKDRYMWRGYLSQTHTRQRTLDPGTVIEFELLSWNKIELEASNNTRLLQNMRTYNDQIRLTDTPIT